MTDVLTALVVRLKRRAIRPNTKGEVLASDLLKSRGSNKRTVRACKVARSSYLFGPPRLRLRVGA